MNRAPFLPILFAVTSVPVLTYGAWRKEKSPQFNDWFISLSNSSAPDTGLGLGIGTWWVFVAGLSVFAAIVFCFFLVISRTLVSARAPFLRCAALIVATSIFLLSAVFLLSAALTSLQWGFTVYALGEAIAGLAAGLGLVAVWRKPRADQDAGINFVTSLRSSTP